MPDTESAAFQESLRHPKSVIPEDSVRFLMNGKNTITQVNEVTTVLKHLPPGADQRIALVSKPDHGTRILRMLDQQGSILPGYALDVALGGVDFRPEYIANAWKGEIRALLYYMLTEKAALATPADSFPSLSCHFSLGSVDVV